MFWKHFEFQHKFLFKLFWLHAYNFFSTSHYLSWPDLVSPYSKLWYIKNNIGPKAKIISYWPIANGHKTSHTRGIKDNHELHMNKQTIKCYAHKKLQSLLDITKVEHSWILCFLASYQLCLSDRDRMCGRARGNDLTPLPVAAVWHVCCKWSAINHSILGDPSHHLGTRPAHPPLGHNSTVPTVRAAGNVTGLKYSQHGPMRTGLEAEK